jgi:signal peptidase complex subunit 2
MEWFDGQGRFVTVPFQQMLATGVPLVGKLNPERVVLSQGLPKELLEGSPEVLDAILASGGGATGLGSAVASETGAKKATKRRKG